MPVRDPLTRLRPFPPDFYLRNTVDVAQGLVGAYLLHKTGEGELIGRIVETEAYREDDPASHSYRGPTGRNRVMFEAGGIAYVYFIYGMYNCFNVVAEAKGTGCAVLIRAMEPVDNVEIMWSNRFPGEPFDPRLIQKVADGPGKLCRAMKITREHNGLGLSGGLLRVMALPDHPSCRIAVGRRIGIRQGADIPWRFFDPESPAVSR